MSVMTFDEAFRVLGIEPTRDAGVIKAAYREKLSVTNPEDDQEGFRRLREAFELADRYSKTPEDENEEQQEDTTPSGLWVAKASEIYSSLSKRCDKKAWEELFAEDAFLSLEEEENCKTKFLVFLMDHFRLPTDIWKLLDERVGITGDTRKLKEQFPGDFVNYIVHKCAHGEEVEFESFRGADDADYDLFLRYCDQAMGALGNDRVQEAEEILAAADALGIAHPVLEITRAKILDKQGKTDEIFALLERVGEEYPDDTVAVYSAAEFFWDRGRKEKAVEYYKRLKEQDDTHYMANYRLTKWYYKQGEYSEAKSCAEKVLSTSADDKFMELLRKINENLEAELEKNYRTKESWEEGLDLGWCYLQDGRVYEATRLAHELEGHLPEERDAEYKGLLAKLAIESADYEEAAQLAVVWEKALEEKEQERQEQQKQPEQPNEENGREEQVPPPDDQGGQEEQNSQEEQSSPEEQTPQEEQSPQEEQPDQPYQEEEIPQNGQSDQEQPPEDAGNEVVPEENAGGNESVPEPSNMNTEEQPAELPDDTPQIPVPETEEPVPAEDADTGMTGRNSTAPDGFRSLYSDKPSDHLILHSGGQRLVVRTAEQDTAGEEDGDPFADIPEELPDEIRQRIEEAYEDVETAAKAAGEYLSREEVAARLESARDDLEEAYAALDGGSISSIAAGISKLVSAEARIQSLMERIQRADTGGSLDQPVNRIYEALRQMDEGIEQLPQMMSSMEQGISMLTQGQLDAALGFSQAANGLFTMQQQLEQASAQYESARTEALKSANIDTLVTAPMLSQLIYAQNFSMPAGYIDDKDDRSWLLKIGEEFDTSEDIAGALLADIDGIGTIRLSDVADITVIDNAGVSYTKLNGQNGVVVSIYKSSTASTSEVSEACKKAIKELVEDKPGTNVVILMDQGSYINLIVSDILSSMALGAFLAVIVLALFLRDVRPTVMVGISIPLSVLFTMVLMYFSNLSLNIMTMAGISLGVGMLVDNSIVVMENIIRLRQRGTSPARASVQGAKQVSGSIIASTLTTICVFLPMIFTTGTVRELLLPMALSITYCLTASLIVAMTVIPASASVILKRIRPKRRSLFDRILDIYGTTLAWTLRHKLIVMAVAVGLLAFCIWRLIVMGIVMLPDMSSDTIQVDIRTPAGLEREESYAMTDEIAERIMSIDGVADVGIMDSSSTAGLVSVMTTSSGGYGSYLSYVIAEDNSRKNLDRISGEIKEVTDDILGGSVKVADTAMGDMTALMSRGLSVNVYGTDLDKLYDTGNTVADSVMDIRGFTNVRNSAGSQEQSLLLHIDKDKAMGLGLTVAQIYAEIAGRMQTEVTSTSITTDGITLSVHVRDETKPLTKENLLDLEFKTTPMFPQMPSGSDAEESEEAEEDPDASGSEGEEAGLADLMSLFGGVSSSPKEEIHKLSEFATLEETLSPRAINRENQSRYVTVSADTMPGYNTTLLSRQLEESVDRINDSLPHGYSVEIGGESSQVNEMIEQMAKMLLLALAFIYLVMVAQFQSLLSPFIILFTIPLAFTGGMIALLITREQLSMLALMGFLVLMGTVVNNGIVFVDYTNQLRIGGLARRDALIAAGKTRMRPILMTAMTTILAMTQLIFGDGMGAQISRAMALVISGGLIYATLMTLYIVPLVYDILYRKQPLSVDVDSDIDDAPDDAAEFLAQLSRREQEEAYEEETSDDALPEEYDYDMDPEVDWEDGIEDMDTTELE